MKYKLFIPSWALWRTQSSQHPSWQWQECTVPPTFKSYHTNSSLDVGRFAGSLIKHLAMNVLNESVKPDGSVGTGSCTMNSRSSNTESGFPSGGNGNLPTTSSMSVIPRDQTSDWTEYFPPWMRSGWMRRDVPTCMRWSQQRYLQRCWWVHQRHQSLQFSLHPKS